MDNMDQKEHMTANPALRYLASSGSSSSNSVHGNERCGAQRWSVKNEGRAERRPRRGRDHDEGLGAAGRGRRGADAPGKLLQGQHRLTYDGSEKQLLLVVNLDLLVVFATREIRKVEHTNLAKRSSCYRQIKGKASQNWLKEQYEATLTCRQLGFVRCFRQSGDKESRPHKPGRVFIMLPPNYRQSFTKLTYRTVGWLCSIGASSLVFFNMAEIRWWSWINICS